MNTRIFIPMSAILRVCYFIAAATFLNGITATVQASCGISIVNGGPCRVSTNNTPLTNELPHVGEIYPLRIQLNVTGTAQPFDLKLSMGAQTITWQITNSLSSGNGYWWWFPFNSNLDGEIPWQITVDPEKTSGNTNPLSTISGAFSPIPPATAVYTYNTNFVMASETNVLSFQQGSGTIQNLMVVMGASPDLPTQTSLATNLPANSQVITTTPQGIPACIVSYTNVASQSFTNVVRFSAKVASVAVNSGLLSQISWSQLTNSIGPNMISFIQSNDVIQSSNPLITSFVNSNLPANYKNILSPYETAQELHKAVAKHITYTTPSPSFTALDVLISKKGDCGTYATLLTACLRNVGIPAKFIAGFWTNDWHCRTEFFLPSAGWILADACFCNRLDPTGTYAYYFGNATDANEFFAIDSGDSKLIPWNSTFYNFSCLQTANFFWSGGATYITNTSSFDLQLFKFQNISPLTNILSRTFGDPPFSITPPTSSSGLPVILSVKSGSASLSNNLITLTGVGTVTLAANQPGDGTYLAASEVTASFEVIKGSQSITFPAIPSQIVTNSPFTLNATSSSGLSVTYATTSTNISLQGNVVSILGGGTATITASQPGNTNFTPAIPLTNTFTTVKASQVIPPYPSTNSLPYGSLLPFTNTKSTAGLPVSISVKSGPGKLSGNTLSVTGVGTITVAASQAGNGNYFPAPTLTNTFTTVKANQSIAFSIPATNSFITNGVIPLVAKSSSGLVLTYKSGNATILAISGTNAVMKGKGTTTVTASQVGNANYNSATNSKSVTLQ